MLGASKLIGRRLRDEGKPIWEAPVRIGEESHV
jgi:hypothetical protein